MNTPIHDFVKAYAASVPARLHMPGHKGRGPLGCEELDITEIPGADALYEAAGIIAESEANASRLFGCPTFYSTEGSSHCIRAMLLLAMQRVRHPLSDRFRVLAARNVHKTFLSAAALLDLDVRWLPQDGGNYLTADPDPETAAAAIERERPDALYLTCPDYLGHLPDLRPIAEVCHAHGVLLLVDNAHGAYLRFLNPGRHPMDLGADLCCDSAHKTLPVLTGGAYLHVRQAAGDEAAAVKDALALFGSTSPSYLILQSLDLANPRLEGLPGRLEKLIPKIDALKRELTAAGYRLFGEEPLKLTLDLRGAAGTGAGLARRLERDGVFCEFADRDFLVAMFAPNTTDEDFSRLRAALRQAAPEFCQPLAAGRSLPAARCPQTPPVCTLRAAMLSPCVRIPAAQSLGRVLARLGVSCPPAVPILMPGERIDENALAAFQAYGVEAVDVLE